MSEKYCFLTREEICNGHYTNYDTLFTIQAKNESDKDAWMRKIRCYAQKIDGYYVVVSEDEVKTSTGTNTKFSILKVESDKKKVENYCLEQSRKLAETIADSLKCGFNDYTLEKIVQH